MERVSGLAKIRKTSWNRFQILAWAAEKWAWACSVIVFLTKQDGGLEVLVEWTR